MLLLDLEGVPLMDAQEEGRLVPVWVHATKLGGTDAGWAKRCAQTSCPPFLCCQSFLISALASGFPTRGAASICSEPMLPS